MNLTCPRDGLALTNLTCPQGHKYSAYDGIPVLLRDDVPETIWTLGRSLKIARGKVEPYNGNYVSELVAAAAGHLYKPLIGHITEYPIPELPIQGKGSFLDVGCNWGRWSIAAARHGYEVTGIDSSLDSLLAARQVCRELGVSVNFICGDARYLPFETQSFDQAFSFSVLQHFSKPDARLAFNEMKRVAENSLVEIPGKYGLRAFQNQLRRRFREPEGFDVRYWTPKELREIGTVEPHAYFGTGVLSCDVKYLPWYYKPIPIISDALLHIRPLRGVADSYWVSL